MYEQEFKRINDASHNSSLTFFVGAGVSALSGAPTWKSLIDDICHEMGKEKKESYSSDEYLQIPQMFFYAQKQDREKYYSFIEQHLSSSRLKPNAVHRELFRLNPVSLITTNFDTLLEDAAAQYCQSFKTIVSDHEVPSINGDRFILKVHGDIKHRNIVFREEDYLNYSENFKLTETLLKSIFSTNTVVFIGYGFNDYNIKLILNWAKTLLADDFSKPIFIYTGDEPLTPEELLYQKSRGLAVIEHEKVSTMQNEKIEGQINKYFPRYLSVINAIKRASFLTYEEKTEQEALEVTYELLKPLDKLDALRISDIQKKLGPHVMILVNGCILSTQGETPAIDRFIAINKLPREEYDALDENTKEKHKLILRVFEKARVGALQEECDIYILTKTPAPFGDPNCLAFDYQKMWHISSKKSGTLKEKYCKAFYLAYMHKYDEAFQLFSQVANKAFRENNHVLYYLSEVNCIALYKIMKALNRNWGCYKLDIIEDLLSDDDAENVFRKLPIEFQKQYSSFGNFHSANLLMGYYEASCDAEKLRNAIESNSVEYGLTSTDRVIYRMNESLHFFLGNHLIVDEFSEYKDTLKKLVSLLVYKYSVQCKKTLQEPAFPAAETPKIIFDISHLYCFLEFFDDKELVKLFSQHNIDTIEFQNEDVVEMVICNIVDYYENLMKEKASYVEIIMAQKQIKTCFALLRYVLIPQPLVDKLTIFLLKNEFREIHLDDKISFLVRQLKHRNMYSDTTQKVIEDKLIEYIDGHINALKGGTRFECYSASSNICYGDLVRYIAPNPNNFHSRRLSLRVSRIINENLSALFFYVIKYYSHYVSDYQRQKIIKWANERLRNDFRFDFLALLIDYNARIGNDIILILKEYLQKTINENTKQKEPPQILVFPQKDPYEELKQIGYWCLIGALPKSFSEFVGYSDVFDFYYQYQKFDFCKFQPAWLLVLYSHAIEKIAKNKKVRAKIRLAIAKEIMDNKIADQDREKLQNILSRYFY